MFRYVFIRSIIVNVPFLFLLAAIAFVQLSCGGTVADFDIVFPTGKVNRIDITITPENWQAMLDDMAGYYGKFGQGSGDDPGDLLWDEYWHAIEWPEEDPVYVQCTVIFKGKKWKYVGIRFKGSYTLLRAWWRGDKKLPFKLDFDRFEFEYPETLNQHFYGLKKLSFSNHLSDETCLRHKVAADLLREEGVTAPHSAFYRVFIDVGNEPVYFGLYTVVESPQRSMYVTQIGSSGGNLYKPSSRAIQALRQEMPVDNYTFTKKNNYEVEDWSEVEAFIASLNASREDPATWRSDLEKTFDALGFLKWLAVSNVMQLWDVTGNYYLYSDPFEGKRLHWIPWDFDSSFPERDISHRVDNFFGAQMTLDLSLVDDSRPLVRYLLDDDLYGTAYLDYMRNFVTGNFAVESLKDRFQREHDLITPYVIGEEGELPEYTFTDSEMFESELIELFDYLEARNAEVTVFLSGD